jgi:hypothetical protein
MSTPAEFRDPATRQHNPDLDLRRIQAALKPLLDKLDALEAQYGATYLASDSTVLTSVGVLRSLRAAVDGQGEKVVATSLDYPSPRQAEWVDD